jgi:ArsR family transcriptional regulator, arsenate/arsenite/antimonite-responsive transcriptional repressor
MSPTAETFYTALSGNIRLRCLLLLAQAEELCVCQLTHALDQSQPKISRHLAHLRERGLVLDRREGLWIHYRLHPDLPEWMIEVLNTTRGALTDQTPYQNDLARLACAPVRPPIRCCV